MPVPTDDFTALMLAISKVLFRPPELTMEYVVNYHYLPLQSLFDSILSIVVWFDIWFTLTDCCDASDEYNSSAQCPNNCIELGEQLRQEREEHLRLLKEGNQIREQYIEEAKKKREQSKQELEDLRRQKLQVEEEKNAKDANKKDAEEREKAALDRFKAEEDKLKQQKEEEDILRSQEEDRKLADIAFKEMDLNRDNLLSYTEVQKFIKFDKDGDGVVSEEEAKVVIRHWFYI